MAQKDLMIDDDLQFEDGDASAASKKHFVRGHFDAIAPAYDLADTLLSFGLDSRWRKRAVRLMNLAPGGSILDACGGTAELAMAAAGPAGAAGRVTVYDSSLPMIEVGRGKVRRGAGRGAVSFVRGDAEDLSFPAEAFDAVTIGFGLRNLSRPDRALREFCRVLKPGGRLMVLEFSVPRNAVLRGLYHLYSFYWMPLAARLVGNAPAPYLYLASSIRAFPAPEELAGRIAEAGFTEVEFKPLSNGIAVVHLGRKPKPAEERPAGPAREAS